MLCHGTVCVVGKIRDLILQLSKSSIYSTKPVGDCDCRLGADAGTEYVKNRRHARRDYFHHINY
ncbi:hypothetical protein EJ432_24465 [Klebsiella quasipneumoniae]|nr:hypothetical protein [Klebsiella quasipneumoniae]